MPTHAEYINLSAKTLRSALVGMATGISGQAVG